MKKKITITTLVLLVGFVGHCQIAQKIGDNPLMLDNSAVLEVESTNKGFLPPRMTTVQRDLIRFPKAGLTIYNTSKNCLEWYNGTIWFNGCNDNAALVATYSSTAMAGTMTPGLAVSGVTQTITANVTSIGTYNAISATANGVTFFAPAGTFTATGNQTIQLTATGTPTNSGTHTFTSNTSPSFSFDRTTVTTTAVVSSYTCSTASSGTLTLGQPVSGVTQTITANVTTAGTYIISTTANGVTFSGSGTFAGTGAQNVVLTASGTPTNTETTTFTLSGSPSCSFNRIIATPQAVVSSYSCSTATGGTLTWGQPVSGVTQTITANVTTAGTYDAISAVANGVTFSAPAGTFSATGLQTIELTATGTPTNDGVHSFTISGSTINGVNSCSFERTTATTSKAVVSSYTCSTASTGRLIWGKPVSGVTQTITVNVTTAGTYDAISAVDNGVTFSAPAGTFTATGNQTILLTATGTPTNARNNSFTLNTSPDCSFTRTITIPYVEVIYNCDRSVPKGILTQGQPASGVSQTMTANVIAIGHYDAISLTSNGVTFYAPAGTFSAKGVQTIELTATGTPTDSGVHSFTIRGSTENGANICSFERTTATPQAVVSSYTCSTASTGSLIWGQPVSGVTQTITANVTTAGTYDAISAVDNGVTFSAPAGTFTATGNQTILLTATGTPTNARNNSFTLNTSPDCSFTRTITIPYVEVIYNCDRSVPKGILTQGQPASGVSQTMTANVIAIGHYDAISLSSNGVTFSAPAGTFSTTGLQTIELTATGTPTDSGVHSFTIRGSTENGANICSFERTTATP